jgi:hypothetical protein
MAVITGERRTDNVAQEQRVIEMHKEILLLEPDSTPLTVILNNIYQAGRRQSVEDPKFSWMEDQLETRHDAVNNGAGYADNATSVVVDNGNLFAVEDLVKVPRTGEVLFVTGVSTNTLTVTRGFGSSTAAALVDNDSLYIIGTAAEEGDTSQPARSENPTPVTNYTQIFKHTVESSGTWLTASNETMPHDWPYQHRKTAIEHAKDKELAILLGAPGEETGPDGGKTRTTGGVLYFATENNQDAGGTLTEAEWETWLRSIMRYGRKKKTVIASRLVASVLNTFAAGKLNTFTGATTYGVKVGTFQSVHGEVNLIVHDLLEGEEYDGYAIAIDFSRGEVGYKYLDGNGPGGPRDTKLYTNRQAPDYDGLMDEWITECGLMFGQPQAHGVLTGVTG